MLIGDYYFEIPSFNLNVTSIYFVAFCFLVFVLTVPFKYRLRPYILLIANGIFIHTFGILNLIYLSSFSLLAYLFSFLFKKHKNKKAILLLLLPFILGLFGFKLFNQIDSIILPLGMSFYTFKILSYLIDIYRGKIEQEKNIIYFLDYVMFFPCISAGPINRAKPFIDELKTKRDFEYSDIGTGFLLIALGLFEKMVFCDFIASVVTRSIDNVELVGFNAIIGVLLYSLQIYLDFDSYSNIAIGVSRMLGFKLDKNFNSPYISGNLKEFWAGWHISLTSWFKDYLYIPLGGSKKGAFRKCLNILIVFFVSALWHGLSLPFIIWGLGHGLIRLVEDGISFITKKLNKYIKLLFRPLLMIINFLIVSALWIFFRSPDINTAIEIINRCIQFSPFNYELIGLTHNEFLWMIVIAVAVFISDILRKHLPVGDWLGKRVFILRWVIYVVLIVVFLVFGMYGGSISHDASDFIYWRF